MSVVKVDRRIVGASVGNLVELYDFFIYAVSAPVLAAHFFPASNPTTALLGTYAAYAVSYIVRPLGGAFFGYLADRRGRVGVLVLTVLLMGAGTMLTGLLPAYGTIGIAAPVLLLLCRLAQGFSLGGEASGSYSYIIESAPNGQRARWVNLVACFANLPTAVGGIFILMLRLWLGGQAYSDWGWRIPFIAGGILAAIGFWLRRRLDDPAEFKEAVGEQPVRNPLRKVMRIHRKSLVNVTLLLSLQAVSANLIIGYMYTFLVDVAKVPATPALLSNATALVLYAVLLPVFGLVVDRVGRKPVLFTGAAWLIVTAYPAFKLAASGSIAGAYAGQLLIVIGADLVASYVTVLELFPTAVRGTGHAISYNLGNAIFGGTAPLVATALVSVLGSPLAPAFYIAFIGVFGLVVVAFTPETKNLRLRSSVGREGHSRSGHREAVEESPA